MPKDDPNPNGQKPPDKLHFERSQVTCQYCDKVFKYFALETVNDIKQLCLGDVIISSIDMICRRCGKPFRWKISEKDLEKMALSYGQLTAAIKGYNPE